MPDEVDPMRDLGFVHDKEFVCEAQGILTPANCARDLCEHFIPNGGKLFDLVDRYDAITTLILNNAGTDNGSLRYLAPFLKAFGVSDYDVYRYYDEYLPLTPGAADCMTYIQNVMPLFVNSMIYSHAAETICEKTGIPLDVVGATPLELDSVHMSVAEAREVRKTAAEICKLRMPTDDYADGIPLELDRDEVKLVNFLDEVYHTRFVNNSAAQIMQNTAAVGLSEKAYGLLDIRKSTQVDLDGIMFAGSEPTDFQVLDLVKEGGGLAISFNGSEAAVHGSNVALIDTDCTSLSFIASVFFDTGVQGVIELAENWSLEYLRETDFPDPNLCRHMLESNDGDIPEFYLITDENVAEVAARSMMFRDKLTDNAKRRAAKTVS